MPDQAPPPPLAPSTYIPAPLAPEAPPPGEVRTIQPGLLRARMPLPFAPGHVNIWPLLEHDGGWLAIDTAVAGRTTRALWDQVLAQPALGGRPLTALLVTHFHPDHIGLTGWLCERFGVLPMMTRIEWLMARALWYDSGPDMMAQQIAHFTRAGCPADFLSFVEGRGALYQRAVGELPRSFHALKDGRPVSIGGSEWRVMTGSGHAPDMATLYSAERGVLISADRSCASRPISACIPASRRPIRSAISSPATNASWRCPRIRWCCRAMASPSAPCIAGWTGWPATTPNGWTPWPRPAANR